MEVHKQPLLLLLCKGLGLTPLSTVGHACSSVYKCKVGSVGNRARGEPLLEASAFAKALACVV